MEDVIMGTAAQERRRRRGKETAKEEVAAEIAQDKEAQDVAPNLTPHDAKVGIAGIGKAAAETAAVKKDAL